MGVLQLTPPSDDTGEGRWLEPDRTGALDQARLESALSLYRAALESTADGLLVVDLAGRVTGYNAMFLSLWRIPSHLAHSADDAAMLEFVVDQLADPEGFLNRVREIYADPAAITFDTVAFKDGRTFDRYSRPQLVGGRAIGRVWSFRDVSEQRRTEGRLRDSERWLRSIIDAVPHFIFAKDAAGRFVLANKAVADAYGTSVDALPGRTDADFASSDAEVRRFAEDDRRVIERGDRIHVPEEPLTDATGRVRWLETTKVPIRLAGGDAPGLLGVSTDITARRLLEDELRQSQKMEAIGRLAGGIAHDFNNILTAILGFGAAVMHELPPSDPRRDDMGEILAAARRAADLTRQLLAFSRRQVLDPRVLDLNAVVDDLDRLLSRILGEDVVLITKPAEGSVRVRADRGQLEQVLVNLAVNAREAMPRGGQLTFETQILPPQLTPLGGQVAPVACLRVRDTGGGISDEHRERIFEPFFTTKATGTGLGLAMVYGIVKQSGGEITVESAASEGTTFAVFLPTTTDPIEPAARPLSLGASGGAGTVLVVEDEPAVRRLTCRLLAEEGYQVLEADGGAQAITLAVAHPGPIGVLLTDLVMPGQNGREVAAAIRQTRPGLAVIYMSGYPAGTLGPETRPEPGVPFLAKPFEPETLKAAIAAAIRRHPT